MQLVGATLVKLIATATSGLVSFTTNVIRSVKVTCEFSPVQEGTGDPSPDNVRPISGWTGCNLIQRGQNLVDGTTIKNIIFSRIGTSRRGESPSGWVWFAPSAGDGYPTIFGVDASDVKNKYKFKENTAYTIYFNSTCQYKGNLNIGYTYTDGTDIVITQNTTSQQSHRIVTNASKTLKDIWIGRNTSGWTSIYYPTLCVCEGDVALEDIPTQQSAIVPIAFTNPSTGNPLTVYGGTVTLNEDGSADLAYSIVRNNLNAWGSWTYYAEGGYFRTVAQELYDTSFTPICTSYAITGNNYTIWWSNKRLCVRDNRYNDLTSWLNDMGDQQVVLKRNSGFKYHFPNIGQLQSFIGENNIWHDMNGDITVEYWKKQ